MENIYILSDIFRVLQRTQNDTVQFPVTLAFHQPLLRPCWLR